MYLFQNRTSENAGVSKSPSLDSLDMGLSVQPIANQQKVQQDFAKVENVHGKVTVFDMYPFILIYCVLYLNV